MEQDCDRSGDSRKTVLCVVGGGGGVGNNYEIEKNAINCKTQNYGKFKSADICPHPPIPKSWPRQWLRLSKHSFNASGDCCLIWTF